MAQQEIVSCPGCGKRYSVPPNVSPGQFQCEDCSAVVVYGRPAESGDSASGPALAPSGRKAGRAARARKKARTRSASREAEPERGSREEEGRGRRGAAAKKGGNPTPYILGIVAVAVLGGIGVMVMKKDGKTPDPAETAGSRGGGGGRVTSDDLVGGGGDTPALGPKEEDPPAGDGEGEPAGDPGDAGSDTGSGLRSRPKPGTGKKPEEETDPRKFETVAQPPTGGNYGKTVDELRAMLQKDRASVMADLPHLPDTPPEVAQEIDRLIGTLKNPDAGREVFEAREKLIKIGRPAVPKILGTLADLKFPETEPITDHVNTCLVADQVDIAMREITGYSSLSQLQFSPQGQLRRYRLVTEHWMVFWLSTWYDRKYFPGEFEKKKDGEKEEEL